MFLGLLNPDPDLVLRGLDPAQDTSIIKQNSKKNPYSYCFVTSLCIFIFKNDVNVASKSNKRKTLKKLNVSVSESVSQWYGSADPEPYCTKMSRDPQHCLNRMRKKNLYLGPHH